MPEEKAPRLAVRPGHQKPSPPWQSPVRQGEGQASHLKEVPDQSGMHGGAENHRAPKEQTCARMTETCLATGRPRVHGALKGKMRGATRRGGPGEAGWGGGGGHAARGAAAEAQNSPCRARPARRGPFRADRGGHTDLSTWRAASPTPRGCCISRACSRGTAHRHRLTSPGRPAVCTLPELADAACTRAAPGSSALSPGSSGRSAPPPGTSGAASSCGSDGSLRFTSHSTPRAGGRGGARNRHRVQSGSPPLRAAHPLPVPSGQAGTYLTILGNWAQRAGRQQPWDFT